MLKIRNLKVGFQTDDGLVEAVRGLDMDLEPGGTLGLVGESGSGKSVTSLAVMGLLGRGAEVRADTLEFEGEDLLSLGSGSWRSLRGKRIAMIFQDPMTSLNPLMTCGEQVAEGMRLHLGYDRRRAKNETQSLLEKMEVGEPEKRCGQSPFELSGGLRQRVMIAMALACKPKLLIADEPTTALDVTVQAGILRLIRSLQKETGMALLLITHDLGVVSDMVEKVQVLYAGRPVESGPTQEILAQPRHPYTLGLLRSLPPLHRKLEKFEAIGGTVPPPQAIIDGCRFHPRCFMAEDLCRQGSLPSGGGGGLQERRAACHFPEKVPAPPVDR
jgi:peptide/nickel transport system ATP-binding protein